MAKKKSRSGISGGWKASFLGFLVVMAMFGLQREYRRGIELLELRGYDLRLNTRGKLPLTGKVAIVAIDDKSMKELGRFPWPRSVMAKLVESLKDYKAAVVGLDLMFPEEDPEDVQRHIIAERLHRLVGGQLYRAGVGEQVIDDTLGTDNDKAFAQAVKDQGATYLAFAAPHEFRSKKSNQVLLGFTSVLQKPHPMGYNIVQSDGPPPDLVTARAYLPPITAMDGATAGLAHVDVDEDADGELRTELMVLRFHDRLCIPLALALVSAYRDHAPLSLKTGPLNGQIGVVRVAVGDQEIPVDEIGRMLVNYRGPVHTFPYYSAADVIDRRVPPEALQGKIILVGVDGTGLGDRVVTPMSADFPGVEVHANAVDNILQGDFLRRPQYRTGEQQALALLLGLAVAFAVSHLAAAWAAGFFLTMVAGYVGYADHRMANGVVLDIVFPLVILLAVYIVVASFRYFTEGREKAFLRHAFEHYLSPEVIRSLVDDPEGLKLGGERRHLSILFADIVGFTTRAERAASPEALIAELNVYFTRMLDLVLKNGGVVDKLIGDSIMAFWGAPADIDNPSRHAIDTALAMLGELAKLRQEDPRFADFDIGVGIATGDPVVGNLGGENRFDYSAIGDKVNFAARLEGLTRRFGAHLLVDRQTLDEAGAANYIVRDIGLVKVKGKQQTVPVTEVIGYANDGVDPTFYQRFASVRELIAHGEAQSAVQELLILKEQRLKELGKEDNLIAMYLDNLNHHLADPKAEPIKEMVFEFDIK